MSESKTPTQRNQLGRRAGIVGVLCNVLLFVFKLLAGKISGSVAVTADAFNNLSDASSSVVTLLGFRLAQRPADKDHPFGHARYEYLAGVGVTVLILMIGGELVKTSVLKIISPSVVAFDTLTIGVLTGSLLVKGGLYFFYSRFGKKIASPTLLATATDSRNDVFVTAAVLFCGILRQPIDGYVGFAVALFILYSGIQIGKETISPLLGKQPDQELIRQISQRVLSHDKILGIHDLLIHDYGYGQTFASVHVEISAQEDALLCHDLIDEIECEVLEELGVHLVIHYDPVVLNDREWNELRELVTEVIASIDPQLSMHDFRLVKGAKQTKLVFDLAVPYELHDRYRHLKEEIDRELWQRNQFYPTVIRIDGK